MIDHRKKYKIQEDSVYPHSGKLLSNYFKKEGVNRAALCRKLGIAENGVRQYLKRESLQVGILWKISQILNYNFLAYIAEQLPVHYTTKKEAEMQLQLDEQAAQISDLQKELEVYRRIVGK